MKGLAVENFDNSLVSRYSVGKFISNFPFHRKIELLHLRAQLPRSSREFQGVVEAKAKAEVEVEGKMVNDGGDDVMYT
ncbi:CLUMA_CG002740, isoform A [Clunio marinus]|uniref:CLUMA_CG002740, isoform A n=1 Tax=Clunio marinus TaxID=568069 RepID=A0A1J1HLI7_9DIPT|nr:CLUMA_CG002740, isoform A [Clunio marinus]